MHAHTSTAGSLERAVVAQQARRLHGEENSDMLPPSVCPPEQQSRRSLQQLCLQAPSGGWVPDDAAGHSYRAGGSGDDSPTSAEVEAAMAEHRQLLATNAALDAELAGLEDRAEASVVHMAQLRRVLTQLEKHKDAFALAPDAKVDKAMAVVRSLGTAERAAAEAAIVGAPASAAVAAQNRRRRPGKRPCMFPGEAGLDAEAERYAEGAAKARAAAALSVSGGDPAQALIHLLQLYVRSKTQAPARRQ